MGPDEAPASSRGSATGWAASSVGALPFHRRLARRRLTTSNHWTFVVRGRIGVGAKGVVLDIWVMKVVRPMIVIIGPKFRLMLKAGEALCIPCFSFKIIVRCSWRHGVLLVGSQRIGFLCPMPLTMKIIIRFIIVSIRTRTMST